MMFNVVGTRCVDGDHAALALWYADHVHQLFAFDGLRAATLWQRAGTGGAGAGPDWLCVYRFTDEAAFARYDTSPVRAAAAADRALGWGRDGIEITLRQACRRRYARHRTGGHASQAWFAALDVNPPLDDDQQRALAARHPGCYELLEPADVAGLTLCRSEGPLQGDAGLPGCRWQSRYELKLQWER